MGDIVDVLADFLLRKGPMNIEPLAVRQRLAREILDLVDAGALAATPAVGGERKALVNLVEAIECEFDVEAGSLALRNRLATAKAALAPPASPLRGREITAEMLNAHLKATAEWVDPYEAATECGVPIECGITQEDADELNAQSRESLRVGYAAALSASPPEQPQRNLGVASDSDRTTTVPDRTTDATPRNDPQEPTSRDSRERPAPPEQPASPKNLLRERESVRQIAHRHCTCTCTDDPKVMMNHSNFCDEISDAILEYAALFSAAPEQPAAAPVTGREKP